MTTEGFHRFSFMFGRGGSGQGCSAATCNFTTRCHSILHTEPLKYDQLYKSNRALGLKSTVTGCHWLFFVLFLREIFFSLVRTLILL